VIICKNAKELGKQYTTRLLPDFLVPHGVIRSDKVLEAVENNERNIDKVCSILGCIDSRTARKYLTRFNEAIKRISLSLTEKLSHHPKEDLIPSYRPDTPVLTYVHALIYKINELQIFLHGLRGNKRDATLCFFVQEHWSHNTKLKPSTSVSIPIEPPDTT